MSKIYLTQGKVALVDEDIYELIGHLKWFATKWSNVWYAGRCFARGKKNTMLHNFVMGYPPKGYTVDHVNGDGLDNRRSNLRIVTLSENFLNSWKHRQGKIAGVTFFNGKWQAYKMVGPEKVHLGVYFTKEEAAEAVSRG